MNFHVGQEVVCVETHPDRKVVEGQTYVIRGLKIHECLVCGEYLLADVGVPGMYPPGTPVVCNRSHPGSHHYSDGKWWLKASRFAPLEQDISELTEILSTTKPFEV